MDIPQGTTLGLQGTYLILKQWYQHASRWNTHLSQTDLEKVLGYYTALYHQEDPYPPGWPVPTYVIPLDIYDETKTEG